MAVISISGRWPARKSLSSVRCSFSPHYSWLERSDADVARLSGLTEAEVVMALDCIAEQRGSCTLGHLRQELGEERFLAHVMALVGAGVVSIDFEALEEATASRHPAE